MKYRLFVAIITILLLTGCDIYKKSYERLKGAEMAAPPPAARSFAMAGGMDEGLQPAPAETVNEMDDRKIIHTASLEIEVKEVSRASNDIKSIAGNVGGFIASSRSHEDDAGRKTIYITLRVPSDKLNQAIKGVKGIGHVREENITGEDVTENYFDLETRLKNAEKLEKRILTILDTEAKELKDVLEAEKELTRVREKIELFEGRKRYLDSKIQLATINVELMEPPGFGRGIFDPLRGLIRNALSTFTSSMALLVVFLSGAIPWIIVLVLLIWLMLQFLRHWVRRRREAKERKKHVE